MMIVLMYQPRFAPPIKSGIKRHTIRPERKRPIKVGDELSHRMWEDKAYRSPQVEIATGVCTAVFQIKIEADAIYIGRPDFPLGWAQVGDLDEFAASDGFENWADMLAYFTSPGAYGLPFTGVLIQWEESK
jgi:hypothetical protein